MGDFPLMTNKGTFIINGTERVVVSQLVRSPGVYFERNLDKTSDKDVYTAKVIPSGSMAGVRDRQARHGRRPARPPSASRTSPCCSRRSAGAPNRSSPSSATTSPCAPPWTRTTSDQDEALLDIYRKMRPGEPPTREAAQQLLDNAYFNPKRYDLAKVGRYKVDKKLGLDLPLGQSTLTLDDIVATLRYLVRLRRRDRDPQGKATLRVETDDIDHFGNRRLHGG